MLSALVEEVPDPCGSHTDEHLDEVRSAGVEEAHAGLACDRLGDEGLTGSRRTHEQDSLGDLGADLGVFLRVLEELDDLLELVLGLLLACHILEGDLDVLVSVLLGVALAELHHLPVSGGLTQEHDGESDEDQPRQELKYDRKDRDIGLGAYDLDVL